MAEAPKETYAERAKRRIRERDGITSANPEPATPQAPEADLSPTKGTRPRSEGDLELDRIIGSIDIVSAYNRWVDKPDVTGHGVEIKVSCPIPGHADDEFSACLNTEKNLWTCYVCEQGGDIYDFAAWHFGYEVPSYKREFGKLRQDIARELGYTVGISPVTRKLVVRPQAPENPENPAKPQVTPASSSGAELEIGNSPVISLFDDDDSRTDSLFAIDWHAFCPQNTFLRKWCEIGSTDDQPNEYYFWLGLTILGLAIGRDTHFVENPNVRGNLFVVLVGPTGIGKSKTVNNAVGFVRDALPFSDGNLAGTKIIPPPGSAEAFIDNFSYPLHEDPSDLGRITGYASIRGLYRQDEFQTFIGRAGRTGSVLKPILTEFFDCNLPVETKSRSAEAYAEGHFCSIITGTQPRLLARLLAVSDADSGFMNRWIFVRGVAKTLIPSSPAPIIFDDCKDLIQDVRAWSASHPTVEWTEDGQRKWDKFFHAKLEKYRLKDDVPIAARIDLILKRVMLLLCVNSHQTRVTPQIVDLAESLYPYLSATYGIVAETVGVGELEECMVAIEKLILRREQAGKPPVSIRDLTRALPRYSRKLVLESTSILEEAGSISRLETQGKRGPQTIRYARIPPEE